MLNGVKYGLCMFKCIFLCVWNGLNLDYSRMNETAEMTVMQNADDVHAVIVSGFTITVTVI